MDQVHDADARVDDGSDARGSGVDVDAPDGSDGDLRELTDALEGADELPIDARLALLRRAEEAIAGSLEGLDGL